MELLARMCWNTLPLQAEIPLLRQILLNTYVYGSNLKESNFQFREFK